ncbi:glucokinase [Boothiomyces sp. JEL0838]|nr:glucokinase [Boothiomyces sp. JEL0838]
MTFYGRLMIKYPFATQVVTTGFLFGAGDFITQTLFEKNDKYDYFRTARLVDQGLYAPTFIGVFFVYNGLMEGNSIEQVKQKLAIGYKPALLGNYTIWPAVQLINFKFVPLNYQTKSETFLFGVTTGIAVVATVQYLVQLASYAFPQQKTTSSGIIKPVPVRFKQSEEPVVDTAVNSEVGSSVTLSRPPSPKSSLPSVLETLDNQLVVSSSKLQKIVLHMVSEFKKGLMNDNENIAMLPSFVVNRPNGTEVGDYLALDLGGSNFRVCRVTLEGFGNIRMTHAKYTVSNELKTGSGEKLFDFFAECIGSFCKNQGLDTGKSIPMGFTFSFPVEQTAINKGTLMTWSKGFVCDGVVGQDVVDLLQRSLKKKGLNIEIKALVNDTVGTLMAHAYSDPQTYISVILGTGTNAAYVEKVDNIRKWGTGNGEVIINTEWGNYNEATILPLTPWDLKLDRRSSNPKHQIYEKMISGMYLGEVVRLILVELVKAGELFNGMGSQTLSTPYRFDTAYMSRIERDHSLSLADTKQVLEDVMGVPKSSVEDRRIVRHVCELVGTRAARLAAAGIAALVTKINRLDACTVAIDGSLYEHYPHFGNRMRDALRELLGITAENILLEQARDGSGQGAALIAALA